MKRMTALSIAACLLLVVRTTAALPDKVSFRRDVQPIFNSQCVMCHSVQDPHGGLALDSDVAYRLLVNVGAIEVPRLKRVLPAHPEQSYLVNKINRTHLSVGGKGWWMPPPTTFVSAIREQDRNLIIGWIKQGAKDN